MSSSPKHRLCLASPVFFPTYGGSLLRFKSYLPGLRERGLDIRVYTGTPHNKEMSVEEAELWGSYPDGEYMPVTDIDGVPVHRVKLPDSKGKFRTDTYNNKLLELCRDPAFRPDVIQMVGPFKPRSIPFMRELRAMGIPTLYAVTVAPPKKGRKKWLSLDQRKEVKLFNLLDCIVTNNEPLREFVRAIGIKTRVEIIPNGVDLQRFRPADNDKERQALRSSLGIGTDGIMITTVGGIMPRKGSDILLDAWSRFAPDYKNVHLVLVGPRKDLEQSNLRNFRRTLEKLARRSGSPGRVHYVGLCNNVEEYQRASDIFVLPSEREGMPNSVLEAMASRVPVVITPFKGLSRDLGKPGTHFMLCERNAEALSAALRQLLDEPALQSELAEQGYNWVTKTMGIEKSLDSYAALYHELAAAHKPRQQSQA